MRSTMSLPSLRRQCILASAALLAFAPSGTNGSASNPATTRVAVVGGGIAGSMTVLELLERGFQDVTLLERNPDLLQSTSSMIAATVNFDSMYREDWKSGPSVSDALAFFRKGTALAANYKQKAHWLEFLLNGAVNAMLSPDFGTEVQHTKVYRLSRDRLIHHLGRYPELCDAAIGVWCCQAGDAAKAVIEARGYACPADPDDVDSPFGLYQLAHSPEKCSKFVAISENEGGDTTQGCDDERYTDQATCRSKGHTWVDVTYSYYDAAETKDHVGGFLQEDREKYTWCALAEHEQTGFIRTEEIFKIFERIFEAANTVRVATSCTVAAINANGDGTLTLTSEASGLAPGGACSVAGDSTYDKVVLASSLGIIPLLKELDPNLKDHLIGMKGYGLMANSTGTTEVVPGDEKGRAVKYLHRAEVYQAAYARTTESRHVKIWGGAEPVLDGEWETPYQFVNAAGFAHIFEDGPASAVDLAEDPTAIRNTGMRPVNSLGTGVPMLKRYEDEWSNLFLNTGYGWNGYDLAWFSSNCIAEWVENDVVTSDRCDEATYVGHERKVKMLPRVIIFLMFCIVAVAITLTLLCYPVCAAFDCCRCCLQCCVCFTCLPRIPCCPNNPADSAAGKVAPTDCVAGDAEAGAAGEAEAGPGASVDQTSV